METGTIEQEELIDEEVIIRFRVTAEIDIPEDFISDRDTVAEELLGTYIKIKDGLYGNIASGFVVSVEQLPDNTEERSEQSEIPRG